ncbi:hypothetical protein P3T24_006598 [Paraburkholderia sp. GAS33]|uniref:hypothetical protein n=1 Tax=Paraburkholderia sp. GAS33 TaxID=3035130 RepID=UPI003D1E257C
MSNFAAKQFRGLQYTFGHLQPLVLQPLLTPTGGDPVIVPVDVQFGCHCFTEEFKDALHQDEHRYSHLGELRAFDVIRYECSLQLPAIVNAMLGGMIYWCKESYTYVTRVTLPDTDGVAQDYSLFFSLTKNSDSVHPALNMFVKSAYLRGLAAPPASDGWRFRSLIGLVSGVYEPPKPKERPKKKKKGKEK